METLTRVMARTLYGLDMADLPLERLTEQKRKRRPHLQQERYQFNKQSFSRWSRMEKANASPKQIMSTEDKTGENEKPNTPVLPQAQRPLVISRPVGDQLQSRSSPKPPAKVLSSANNASFPTSASRDDDSPFRSVASSPAVAAGLSVVVVVYNGLILGYTCMFSGVLFNPTTNRQTKICVSESEIFLKPKDALTSNFNDYMVASFCTNNNWPVRSVTTVTKTAGNSGKFGNEQIRPISLQWYLLSLENDYVVRYTYDKEIK